MWRLCFVMWLCACGDNDNGRPDVDTSASNLCRQIAEVACFDLYQCCAEAEIEDRLGVSEPRHISECIDDVEVLCGRNYAELELAAIAGTVNLDADVMNSCLSSLLAPAGECQVIAPQAPWDLACKDIEDTAWIGSVPTGGECWIHEECADPNGYCGANLQCAVKPGPGMSCATVECASGSFCRNGICAARLAAGAPCQSSVECQDMLFCNFTGAPSVCTALRDVGHTCNGSFECKSNNCRPGTCIGSGQPCFNNSQCGGRCSDDSSFCNVPSDCGPGICSGSTQQCFADFQCSSGLCNFPVQCLPGACMGPAICAPERVVLDYCADALFRLPLL